MIVGRDEESIAHHLGDRRGAAGDDRQRRRHRFEKNDSESFLRRRKSEDARVAILGDQSVERQLSEELHSAAESELGGELFEPLFLGTDADDSQDGAGAQKRKRAEQRVNPFAPIQVRDAQDAVRTFFARRFAKCVVPDAKIDRFRDDVNS